MSEPFMKGGTCLVHQPRLCDRMGSMAIPEDAFLARVLTVEDGEILEVSRLGPIPEDDTSTITGDGQRVQIQWQLGAEIYPDTPRFRCVLRALLQKEKQAQALEEALRMIADIAPNKLGGTPIMNILTRAGRYR